MIRLVLFLGLLCGVSSCAVYMPMQNAAPDIRAQHEGEVRASTFLSRWEMSAAYSPLKHVLVRGALGRRSDNDDSTFWRGRQYELAAGTYWAPRNWTLGVLGGFGQARNQARYEDGRFIFFGQSTQHEFDVRFNKLFGEAYAVYEVSNRFSVGVSCRSTRLYFTTLTDVGAPIDLRQLTRYEPMLLLRFGLGDPYQDQRPIQLQLSMGGSGIMGPGSRLPYDLDYSRRQLRDPRSYVALGIGILPHRLVRLLRQP